MFSKSWILVNYLILQSYRKKIILKWFILYLNNLYFFNVHECLAVPFTELERGGSREGHLHYTRLLVRAFLQSHKLNLTYCSISCLLLAFCFLYVCIVDQNQMYLSPIWPLVWTPSYLEGGWDFWKIIEVGDQDFLVKMGGSPYRGVDYRKNLSTAFHQ